LQKEEIQLDSPSGSSTDAIFMEKHNPDTVDTPDTATQLLLLSKKVWDAKQAYSKGKGKVNEVLDEIRYYFPQFLTAKNTDDGIHGIDKLTTTSTPTTSDKSTTRFTSLSLDHLIIKAVLAERASKTAEKTLKNKETELTRIDLELQEKEKEASQKKPNTLNKWLFKESSTASKSVEEAKKEKEILEKKISFMSTEVQGLYLNAVDSEEEEDEAWRGVAEYLRLGKEGEEEESPKHFAVTSELLDLALDKVSLNTKRKELDDEVEYLIREDKRLDKIVSDLKQQKTGCLLKMVCAEEVIRESKDCLKSVCFSGCFPKIRRAEGDFKKNRGKLERAVIKRFQTIIKEYGLYFKELELLKRKLLELKEERRGLKLDKQLRVEKEGLMI